MHVKSLLTLSIIYIGTAAAASPPACLLAAINTQDNPADIKGICSSHASDVKNALLASCPASDQNAALSSFADTCKSTGVKITTTTATVSASGSSGSKTTGGSSSPGSSSPGSTKASGVGSNHATTFGAGFVGTLGIALGAFVGGAAILL